MSEIGQNVWGGGGGDLPIVSDCVQITLLQGNSYLLCAVMVIANLVHGAILYLTSLTIYFCGHNSTGK